LISKGFWLKKEKHGFYQRNRAFMVAGAGFEPHGLAFPLRRKCGGLNSAALTVHRTVIHFRLILRLFALRAHNSAAMLCKATFTMKKEDRTRSATSFFGCGGKIRTSDLRASHKRWRACLPVCGARKSRRALRAFSLGFFDRGTSLLLAASATGGARKRYPTSSARRPHNPETRDTIILCNKKFAPTPYGVEANYGCGGKIRTSDLRVMSPTSYPCSTPRYRLLKAFV
jgi:hypothetical protein